MAVSTNEAGPNSTPILLIGDKLYRLSGSVDTTGGAILIRQGAQVPIATIGVPGGSSTGVTTYYWRRAKDSGEAGVVYVTWVTSDINQDYPYATSGPLVHTVFLAIWQLEA